MIQFNKLRLQGFKSFVDKTELEIGPGLTGIVGPNGCGKSNLVEALRWNMGESSTKRMRGGSRSMDDVIFNGTEKRPARNIAEVSMLLDNTAHTAPSPYSTTEEIEVVRRIERDHGSNYKINGKNVRARDVQMLYADVLAGANSPYLVSQGKVASIIQAKPSERKMILEEAAGISGLYARRHEAELRLRATDKNLMRLDDILGGMEARFQELKKQARQASRYKNYSAQIRQLDVSIACLEWRIASEKLHEVKRSFAAVESLVAEHMIAVSQLTKTQNEQAKDLPELRQRDAELSAKIQTYRLSLQRLEDEFARLSDQQKEAEELIKQVTIDRKHESETLADNTILLEKLVHEERNIRSKEDHQDKDLMDKENAGNLIQVELDALEQQRATLLEKNAAFKASRDSLQDQLQRDIKARDQAQERLSNYEAQISEAASQNKDIADTDQIKATIEDMEAKITVALSALEMLNNKHDEAAHALKDTENALREAQRKIEILETEIETLSSIVNEDDDSVYETMFDSVKPDSGFEIALSRALGDSLMGSEDESAPVVWQGRAAKINEKDLPSLPDNVEKLQPHVKAPLVLKAALSQVGYVSDIETGNLAAQNLKPGQSIVSADGAYWRWDGLYIKAGSIDHTAQRLQQKNKLQSLEAEQPALQKKHAEITESLARKSEILEAISAKIITAREDKEQLVSARDQAQRDLNHAIESGASYQAEQARLKEAVALAKTDISNLEIRVGDHQLNLADFDDAAFEKNQAHSDELQSVIADKRQKLQAALNALELARSDHNRRKARLQAIGDERITLQNRCIRAQERLKDLDKREQEATEKLASLKDRPAEIKTQTQAMLADLGKMEEEKSAVSARLALLENELHDTTKALKEAESVLSDAREKRAHALATAEERQKQIDATVIYIRDHFDLTPEALMAEAALDPESLPEIQVLKESRDKAVRARDMIGAVNLRAEQESEDLEKELGGILSEKNDLTEAVEELRQGINKLNDEARERLQAAFDHVNGYFRDMFTRLFHGGKAHLAMIESDDPLEAGLEIFAQPPGKALQSLSLLSGGEQTLTAVALIFAMFLTNPAPICVLDEVDAPLDDANVDRFCDMLEEFAERGETRFLIITHHRLTMARMDRLYGVTMAENGVSKLVSVDLNQQFDFLDVA
jgi:chromosome segregation protein